ncbi:N-acetyltransferase [Poriferisphaera sp. WC338]|uniref:N-acetyltransferase n=1 Tax=Poriferisphaera sp. WC338 TaxID=3425129 RepID=UPI003D81B634
MPTDKPEILYRKATLSDVPAIHRIIGDCAELGLMLPQSLAVLYENIRKYHVAIDATNNEHKVIGVCGLSIIWANMGEISSLAVDPNYRGHGIGKALTQHCLDEAHELSIKKIITLTYEQQFFESLGFSVVDRQTLPLKVWSVCINCPKNQACDEIAMIIIFDDIDEIHAPNPASLPQANYTIPITLSQTKISGQPNKQI